MRKIDKKLNSLIPGGAHTYSRGFDQFSHNAPQILKKACKIIGKNLKSKDLVIFESTVYPRTTEDICDTIQKYIEAGAYKLVVRPLCAEAESMEQLSIIGEEVLRNFHNAIIV